MGWGGGGVMRDEVGCSGGGSMECDNEIQKHSGYMRWLQEQTKGA